MRDRRVLEIDRPEHDDERPTALARARHPLSDRRDEHLVEIEIGHACLAAWGRRLGDDRCGADLRLADQARDRWHHGAPARELFHPFGRAERRERDRPVRRGLQVAVLEEGLERAAERARCERQALRRDLQEEEIRAGRAAGRERVEDEEAEERGREAGRREALHRLPPRDAREGDRSGLARYLSTSMAFAIDARKSLFVFVFERRWMRSSVPSIWPTAESIFRRSTTCRRTSGARRFSSRRVPEAGMLMAGKVRRSWSLRSRIISELPVPLNSS